MIVKRFNAPTFGNPVTMKLPREARVLRVDVSFGQPVMFIELDETLKDKVLVERTFIAIGNEVPFIFKKRQAYHGTFIMRFEGHDATGHIFEDVELVKLKEEPKKQVETPIVVVPPVVDPGTPEPPNAEATPVVTDADIEAQQAAHTATPVVEDEELPEDLR